MQRLKNNCYKILSTKNGQEPKTCHHSQQNAQQLIKQKNYVVNYIKYTQTDFNNSC